MADETSEGAEEELVRIERPHQRVAHLVLNRPQRRNALTGPLAQQFVDALDTVAADDDVTVMVIRGAGGAFCSGLDLKEFAKDPQPGWVKSFASTWRSAHCRLFESDRIIIGALERAAVNGGAALALACDFLVAGEHSFLQVGEIQQGMAAPMNMAWLRLRFDEALAARLVLLGDRVSGDELVRLGVAHRSVADDQVLAEVDELAMRLAEHDPAGVRRIKTSLRRTVVHMTAEEWFAQALAADPAPTATTRPVAATDS